MEQHVNANLFDGKTYEPARDQERLISLQQAVLELMRDGLWRSPFDIKKTIKRGRKKVSDASISARLRDLRKEKWGSWNVDRKYVGDGLWIYRVWK